jgi:hypothetical protein
MANHGHCGAAACDGGRRTFIPAWVRQDTTVRMVNNGHCGARRGAGCPAACSVPQWCPATIRPQSARFTMRPQSQAARFALPASGVPAQSQAASPSQSCGTPPSLHALDTLRGALHNGAGEPSLRLIERSGAGALGRTPQRAGGCCKPAPCPNSPACSAVRSVPCRRSRPLPRRRAGRYGGQEGWYRGEAFRPQYQGWRMWKAFLLAFRCQRSATKADR